MGSVKGKIAKDFFAYTTATYLTQLLGVATSLAMRYFLDPAEMGVWSLLDLVLNYGLYSNFGILTALYTEVPYLLGKGDVERAKQVRDTSFSFTMLGAVICGALFALWAVFAVRATPELRFGVAVIGLILVVTSLYNFYVALMWATKDFRTLSMAIVLNASLYLALIFVFVSRAKLNGLLLSVLLSVASAAAFLAVRTKAGVRFTLKKDALWNLLKVSTPLVASGFVYMFFMSVDRLVITRELGLEALGHYSIALLVTAYANVIPKLLAVVVFPNMQQQYGESGSRERIGRFVVKPATLLCYGLPFLLGAAYLAAPFVVGSILPKYEPGLGAMRIFLLGTFFISLCQPIQTYLTTIYKRWQLLFLAAFGAAVALGCSYAFVRRGLGLEGVAMGMSAGFFMYYTVLLFYVFGHFVSGAQTLAFYRNTLICFAYYAALVFVIARFVHPFAVEWENALFQIGVLAIFCAPLLWIANRSTAALSGLWAAVTEGDGREDEEE